MNSGDGDTIDDEAARRLLNETLDPSTPAQDPDPPDLDDGPSLRWAILLAVVGAIPALLQLAGALRALPERGWQHSVIPLLLGTSVLLGAFSLARLLQLMIYAATRPSGSRRREPSYGLTQAHSLHAVWLIGLGASIAFMGVLGVWSALDGRPSGLEPGWPLIVLGAGLAALSAGCGQLTGRIWNGSEGGR